MSAQSNVTTTRGATCRPHKVNHAHIHDNDRWLGTDRGLGAPTARGGGAADSRAANSGYAGNATDCTGATGSRSNHAGASSGGRNPTGTPPGVPASSREPPSSSIQSSFGESSSLSGQTRPSDLDEVANGDLGRSLGRHDA